MPLKRRRTTSRVASKTKNKMINKIINKLGIGALTLALAGSLNGCGNEKIVKSKGEDTMPIKKLSGSDVQKIVEEGLYGKSGVQIVEEGPIEIYGKPVYVFGDTLKYNNKKYLLPQNEVINLDDFIDSVVIKKQNIGKYLIMEDKK